MLIVLVSVILEVGLISYHDAFIQVVTEVMGLSLIAANTIFGTVCIFVAAPAIYYGSEFLGLFKRIPSVQAQPSKGRAYSIRTAQEIFESITDCTSMHSDTIVRPYIGKWLKVNSVVQDVLEFSDELSILIDVEMKEGSSRTIFMEFNKKRWKARLETAKIGDRLIAEGKIEEIETHTMELVDCEIIEIKPKESSVSKEVPPSIDPSKGDFK